MRAQRDIAEVLHSSSGAVRTGPLEVSWDGGAVVSRWFPDTADTADTAGTDVVGPGAAHHLAASGAASSLLPVRDVAGCPDGIRVHWFCFYQHAGYFGRMLQFRDCPSTQRLGRYAFRNTTTSWVNNRSGVMITVYDGTIRGTVLWREYGRALSANVGWWANDRADTFTCRT